MKRKKNAIEKEFDAMADSLSRILSHAIMLFPVCLIGGTLLIIKMMKGMLSNNCLIVCSISMSVLIYWMITLFIYDSSLEKHVRKICKAYYKRMEAEMQRYELEDETSLHKAHFRRDIKAAAKGRNTVSLLSLLDIDHFNE